MRWIRGLIIISLLWLALLPLQAQEDASQPTATPETTLTEIHYALQTIDDLHARGILSADELQVQSDYYLAQAERITGETLTPSDVEARVMESNQPWWRFITFVNIIWLFASLMIVLALAYIFRVYIFPFLRQIPLTFYEILLYIGVFGLMFVGWRYFEPHIGQFVVMPAVLGLIPLLPWSYARHVIKSAPEEDIDETFSKHRYKLMVQYLILAFIWGGLALLLDSSMIGFLTVVALVAVLGLSPMPDLIRVGLRLDKDYPEPIIMVIALALVTIYIIGEVQGFAGQYRLFEDGVYTIGTWAYFTTLAVVASRYYNDQRKYARARFWFWQVVAFVSGLLALFVGVMLEIGALQEMGGTFLSVYVLEKYVELLDWKRYWAWALLGLGVLLFLVALLINQYPQFFLVG